MKIDPNSLGSPTISGDGQVVAFAMQQNIGGHKISQVIVRDRVTGEMSVVSRATNGRVANGDSGGPSLSEDGRVVAFSSDATNLVPGDTNKATDIFVRNLETHTTVRASVSSSGGQANEGAWGGSILSSNGRFVAFESTSSNLVANDTNNAHDIFVHDMVTGTTSLVSEGLNGRAGEGRSQGYNAGDGNGQGYDGSTGPTSVSSNGSLIAFVSYSTDLVSNDTNGKADVFVRDLLTKKTTRISTAPDGSQLEEGSSGGGLSQDGLLANFSSTDPSLASHFGCETTRDESGLDHPARIYLKDLESGQSSLVGGCTSATNVDLGAAAISNQGRTIAGAGRTYDGNTGYFVIYRDGVRVSRLWEVAESWSTSTSDDGRYVTVYVVDTTPQYPRAFVYDVNSGSIRAIWNA
jgi:Tol biopolymer transport system component